MTPAPMSSCSSGFDGRYRPSHPLIRRFRVEPAERLGPRATIAIIPVWTSSIFSNEQGCSVTAYRLDPATGTLSAVRTITTLPQGFRHPATPVRRST